MLFSFFCPLYSFLKFPIHLRTFSSAAISIFSSPSETAKGTNKAHKRAKLHSLHMRGTALANMPAPPIQSQLALRLSFLYRVIALCIFPLCWMKAQGQAFHPDISQTSLLQSLNITLPLDLCLSFHLEVEPSRGGTSLGIQVNCVSVHA